VEEVVLAEEGEIVEIETASLNVLTDGPKELET
jgi:hypothetical protein